MSNEVCPHYGAPETVSFRENVFYGCGFWVCADVPRQTRPWSCWEIERLKKELAEWKSRL